MRQGRKTMELPTEKRAKIRKVFRKAIVLDRLVPESLDNVDVNNIYFTEIEI
jgi:hypothetical protein